MTSVVSKRSIRSTDVPHSDHRQATLTCRDCTACSASPSVGIESGTMESYLLKTISDTNAIWRVAHGSWGPVVGRSALSGFAPLRLQVRTKGRAHRNGHSLLKTLVTITTFILTHGSRSQRSSRKAGSFEKKRRHNYKLMRDVLRAPRSLRASRVEQRQ